MLLRDVLPALAALEARAHVRPLVSAPPLVLLAVELPWSHGLSLRSFAQEGRSGAKDIASARRATFTGTLGTVGTYLGIPWIFRLITVLYLFDALQVTPVQYLHLPGGNTRGWGIERNTETLAQADTYMSYFKTNTITHSDDKTETKETESHLHGEDSRDAPGCPFYNTRRGALRSCVCVCVFAVLGPC